MSPNRLVVLLTPLVFAPAAGAICAYLSRHFPGVKVDPGDVQQVFVAGALIALVPAAQWLHGWQKHEAREAGAEHAVELATAAAAAVGLGGATDEPLDAGSELEDVADGNGRDTDFLADLEDEPELSES